MTGKSAHEAEKPLLARFASALDAGDDALRAVLFELGIEQAGTRFLSAARELRQRARAQAVQPSATELELALGVLWALHVRQSASEAQ